MRPVSDRFLGAVTRSHEIAIRCELYRGTVGGGTLVGELDVVDGTVTLDSSAAIRGRCELTVAGEEWIPEDLTSALVPYGHELRIWHGIQFSDDTEELVSLGIFRLEEVEIEDGMVRVSGLDRAQLVIEASFEEPYEIAPGTLITDAISTVLREVVWVPQIFVTSDVTAPLLLADEGEDRWAFAQGLAVAIGNELYFDGDGSLVLRPQPSPVGDPVLEIAEGTNGVLLDADKRWHREETNNRVIATGENLDAEEPIPRGVATDDNPSSPTYYFGPFGRKPYFANEYSQFITTQQQAQDAAEGILAARLGTTQEISFGAIANPALEPGDVVLVKREDLKIDETHVIDSLQIPLGDGTMNGATRATQVFGD